MYLTVGLLHDVGMTGQVVLAFFLGAILGWERENSGRYAGIRTFAAISMGACVFGLISWHAGVQDTTRIAAQVVSGIGFLGAGLIFRQGESVTGLTTAATLWVAAAVGLAVAYQQYFIAVASTLIMLVLLLLPRTSWWKYMAPTKNQRRTEK